MRSLINKFKFCFEAFLVSGFCTFLTWLFLFVCKADGETQYLLVWTAVTSFLIFVSFRLQKNVLDESPLTAGSKQSAGCRRGVILGMRILAFALLACGAAIVFVQLGAAQRSFAEAWFEYARDIGPYGFFSFFAAEIYAFMLMIPVFSFARKQYLLGTCTVLAITSLCAGIILGKQVYIILTVVLILIPLIKLKKWQTIILPLTISLGIAAVISFFEISINKNLTEHISIDTSSIMVKIDPDFPLLISVPGYGYDVGTKGMAHSANLSTHKMFQVQGTPKETLYLTTEKLIWWNGEEWYKSFPSDKDKKVQLVFGNDDSFIDDKQSEQVQSEKSQSAESKTSTPGVSIPPLSFKLLEDFYSIIPCTLETYAVRLPKSLEKRNYDELTDKVISFEKVLPRNTEFSLYRKVINSSDELPAWDFNSAVIPAKVAELAETLMTQAKNVSNENNVQEKYIQLALEYLTDGFSYSIKTPQSPNGVDPFEYFLFESKIGFCTWYAGSFTLLMQAQKIPCRIVEGFRITLDNEGKGIITGRQAHAWPEVYLNGNWRIFEATPVFNTRNISAYINENDRQTLNQLSDLLKVEEVKSEEKKDYKLLKTICVWSLLLVGLLIFCFVLYMIKESYKLENKLKRIVRMYNKRGIALPSETGWLSWQKAVINIAKTENEKKEAAFACKLSNQMIERVYKAN